VLTSIGSSPWIRFPLVAMVALVLQTTLFTDLRPFGALGDVMLLLSICAGLAAGPQLGAVCGFGSGLAYDLMLRTPFGLSALTYAVTGFACGYLQANLVVAPWWLAMGVVAAASVGAVAFYAVVGTVFGLEHVIRPHLIVVILVVSVLNGLFAVPVLGICRWALRVARE
jgi:rod shape-determining protein MreD